MNRDDIDWPILTGAMVMLGISIVVSGAMLAGSLQFRKQMMQEHARNNAMFQNISQRYLAIDEEEKRIQRFYPRFVELYNRGIIGREQRLNWIEVLRESGEVVKVPGLNYEIKAQSIHAPEFAAVLGRFQLFTSQMVLNMQLLHEGDLFRLLELLDGKALGTYTVTRCRLTRATPAIDLNPSRPNITTQCELNWFTIKLADGTEISV
jgi:hypothetical protein